MEIALLKQMKEKAGKLNKTVVLPESHDERVLRAAEIIMKDGFAKVVTIGDESKIKDEVKKLSVNLDGVRVINPALSDKFSSFSSPYYELRKKKGMTPE